MTPKEKAIELVNKFSNVGLQQRNEGIACALIAVDEILNHHYQEQSLYRIDTYYWREVKKEILKL